MPSYLPQDVKYLPGALPASYYAALDREFYVPQPREATEPGILPMEKIGLPTHPMRDQVEGLRTRIFQGAKRVELGFSGIGKGALLAQSITPEMYGKTAREAMRDLARLNKIELTTHASIALPPLSGFQQRAFSDEVQARTLRELQRTIDFAADVARGGPIVVHLNEYPRPIGERDRFRSYEKEDEEKPRAFVNRKTGEFHYLPVGKELEWPEMEVDEHGRFKTDEHGNLIPKYDPETGGFKLKKLDEEDVKRLQAWYKEKFGEELPAEKAYLVAQLEGQLRREEAVARHVSADYDILQKRMEDLKALERLYQDASREWDDVSRLMHDASWKRLIAQKFGLGLGEDDFREMSVEELFKRAEQRLSYEQKYMRDLATNHLAQESQIKDLLQNIVPAEEYAVEKTAEGLARAAEYAMEKTRELAKRGELEKPLYIAPENIFPETYGSHPDELKRIIDKARDVFVKRLLETGKAKSVDEAKRLAQQHIRGTFDIGHAYLWKKYWKGSEKEFNEWLLEKAKKLIEDGYIGHVHITDNMGYEDEHLSPGEGIIPIKEFLKSIQKEINTSDIDVIVEPAHQDFDALKAAWREYAGMIVNNLNAERWVNVEGGYFGRTSSPYFLVGELAPNPLDYRVWSQTPYE